MWRHISTLNLHQYTSGQNASMWDCCMKISKNHSIRTAGFSHYPVIFQYLAPNTQHLNLALSAFSLCQLSTEFLTAAITWEPQIAKQSELNRQYSGFAAQIWQYINLLAPSGESHLNCFTQEKQSFHPAGFADTLNLPTHSGKYTDQHRLTPTGV